MRKLRKEIRTLEKLECIRLNKALGSKPEDDLELLRQVRNNQSSFDSLLTEDLELDVARHTDATQRKVERHSPSKPGTITVR